MWASDMRRLVGATDVRDVLACAEANGDGRIYTVKVEIPGIDKPTLAQIAGDDPTQAGPPKG